MFARASGAQHALKFRLWCISATVLGNTLLFKAFKETEAGRKIYKQISLSASSAAQLLFTCSSWSFFFFYTYKKKKKKKNDCFPAKLFLA